MMRRFTSGPKPASRVRRVHLGDVGAVDPEAVPHAVVAGEVARRLGRRDQVVAPTARRRSSAPCTRSTFAPAASSPAAARSTAACTSGWMPSTSVSSSTIADPQPGDVGRRRRAAPARRVDRRAVERSWPQIASSSSAASSTVVGERPDLVEARRERDQAVARDPAVGGLEPDDAAQRRGLADRAAGVGAERERREPGRHRRGRAAARAARARASGRAGCGSAPKAEFSVDEPIANSSRFVLPIGMPPASREAVDDGRGVRRAASPRGCATSRWSATPRVQRLSLSATGTPASGPGSSPRPTAASTASAAASASSRHARG